MSNLGGILNGPCVISLLRVSAFFIPRAFDLNDTEKEAISQEEREKQQNKINGLTWAGFRKGSVFTGHYPITFGSFTYQIEGSKYMATMSLQELADLTLDSNPEAECADVVKKAPLLLQDCLANSPTT